MNNKKTTLLASMLLCGCVFGYAQRTPTHPLDIQDKGDQYLLENIWNWEAGTPVLCYIKNVYFCKANGSVFATFAFSNLHYLYK